MKKVKRLAAILAAAVLCMGIGMPALAAPDGSNDIFWSPTGLPGGKIDGAVDANGNKVDYTERDIPEKTKTALSDEGKVREIFEKCGFDVNDQMDFLPVYSGNISVTGGGLAVAVFSAETENLMPGDGVYALRETAPGSRVFEVYTGEVGANGKVRFNIQGSANYVLVKVLSDGSVVTLDKKTDGNTDENTGLTVDSEVAGNEDNKVTITNATLGKDADGNVIEAGVHVSELESDIEQLIYENYEAIFDSNYHYLKNENSSIELVYKGEFDRTDDGTGTVKMYFTVKDENEDTYYYALHGVTNADGQVESWEIIECKKDDTTGELYFELDSFSPVAIIRVTSDQKPVLKIPTKPSKPSRPGAGGSSSSANKTGSTTQQEIPTQLGNAGQSETMVQIRSSEKTSPKTGEF